jgi:hypothetical protein
MRSPLKTFLAAGVFLFPGAALAQMVIAEPPPVAGEVMVAPPPAGAVVAAPPVLGPPTLEDARMIAMASGIVVVEEVDTRFWDGNFEVEGINEAGEEIEVVIDSATGEVLDIDY